MKAKNVDEYIKNAPKEVQRRLKDIRAAIKSEAPQAEEKISYAMPYYHYRGRLAYFSYFTHHIGLYIPTPTVQEFKNELAGYHTGMATIQFPLNKKLPLTLIKKLIKARMKLNEEKVKEK